MAYTDVSSDAVMTDTASLDFRNTQPLLQQQEDDQLSKRARADVCDAWRLSLCNACAAS